MELDTDRRRGVAPTDNRLQSDRTVNREIDKAGVFRRVTLRPPEWEGGEHEIGDSGTGKRPKA